MISLLRLQSVEWEETLKEELAGLACVLPAQLCRCLQGLQEKEMHRAGEQRETAATTGGEPQELRGGASSAPCILAECVWAGDSP